VLEKELLATDGRYVDEVTAYSGLREENCERFQMIFLLSLIYPEYSFVGHYAYDAHTVGVIFICRS
jgi:hypothetical protein